MKMNIPLMATLLGLSLIVCPLMYIYVPKAIGHRCRQPRCCS